MRLFLGYVDLEDGSLVHRSIPKAFNVLKTSWTCAVDLPLSNWETHRGLTPERLASSAWVQPLDFLRSRTNNPRSLGELTFMVEIYSIHSIECNDKLHSIECIQTNYSIAWLILGQSKKTGRLVILMRTLHAALSGSILAIYRRSRLPSIFSAQLSSNFGSPWSYRVTLSSAMRTRGRKARIRFQTVFPINNQGFF